MTKQLPDIDYLAIAREGAPRSHSQVVWDHIEDVLRRHGYASVKHVYEDKTEYSREVMSEIVQGLAGTMHQEEMFHYLGITYHQAWKKITGR